MVNIDMFRHPNYYKELRKLRNKLDQAISDEASTEATSVRPDPGPKQQASSVKPQATSCKLQDLRTTEKFHGARTEVLNADEGVVRMLHMEANLVG